MAALRMPRLLRQDGTPIEDRDEIARILEQHSTGGLANALTRRNSRFNVGSVKRTFNEPTIGLQILEALRSD